jgi:YbaB/EbfC DNA-binding family protein
MRRGCHTLMAMVQVDPWAAGPDATEAWLEEWSAGADERAAQAQTFADRVAGVSATAADRDGTVRVTVNASGSVTDLRLAEQVRAWPAQRIGEQILAVMRAAQAELAGRVASVAADTLGEDSPVGRDVVDGYRARFPAPEPQRGHRHAR